eukprot:CAMPEP_0181260402 /NCGR_PEP_ID=MMETSP1097-20121128/926_1 /TAXON_ID=35684 /ORGANISM="Pseudopedinella elastica, Strain CCMP716" /LENGTH=210 /DNA_ID=CAMNT_0023358917 /DNA_START=27 /DNA_END=659 /DNA_ORIENTATION=-
MTILYSLISRGKTVLAEFTVTSGNFPQITRVLLGKIQLDKDVKMSYVYDSHVFHYIVEDGVPYAFLEDVKDRFRANYGEAARTAIAFAMNEDFGRTTLASQMAYFNGPSGDALAQVNTKIDDVKNVMVQNIEAVLERGEKLELLVDKTDQLQSQAFMFSKSSKKLRTAMYWRKVKCYAAIFLAVVFVAWIISMMACGGPAYTSCRSKKKK